MSEVDKLLEVRDKAKEASQGLQRLAYAVDQYLGDLPPPLEEAQKWGWDPTQIAWKDADGPSGPYERSEDVTNLQFKKMLKDLGEHDGKLRRDGYFYWTFRNGHTVGRKKV